VLTGAGFRGAAADDVLRALRCEPNAEGIARRLSCPSRVKRAKQEGKRCFARGYLPRLTPSRGDRQAWCDIVADIGGLSGSRLLRRGLRLEFVTLGWNVVGVVVLAATAIAARSAARSRWPTGRPTPVADSTTPCCAPRRASP